MKEEEAGELELADDPQLLLQPPLRLGVVRRAGVAVLEPRTAELRERPVAVRVLAAGIAIAEVAGEVEAKPLREPRGLRDRLRMVGEP